MSYLIHSPIPSIGIETQSSATDCHELARLDPKTSAGKSYHLYHGLVEWEWPGEGKSLGMRPRQHSESSGLDVPCARAAQEEAGALLPLPSAEGCAVVSDISIWYKAKHQGQAL